MSDAPDLTPGFFGKLPALGDFVKRRLPGTFIESWDGWLQQCVASSKSHLGENWLDIYLQSPVWRFTLLPGISGDHGWSGVMIPSVDRVGRYFPLTLAAPMPPDAHVFSMLSAEHWFERAEDTVLSALDEEGFNLDEFSEAVAALGPCCDASVMATTESDPATMRAGWQIELSDIGQASAALHGVAELLTKDRFGRFSVWWTSGSELIKPSLLVWPGLPNPESYTAMLDGQWRESSWHTFGSSGEQESESTEAMLDL